MFPIPTFATEVRGWKRIHLGLNTITIIKGVPLIAGQAEPIVGIPGPTIITDWNAKAIIAKIGPFSTLLAGKTVPFGTERIDIGNIFHWRNFTQTVF